MNPLVAEYLTRLDAALSGLPPARRIDVVDDIRAHIEAEISGHDDVRDADVRTLLDRVGSPSDIAAAALADGGAAVADVPKYRVGGREIWAIVLLLFGGFLLLFGWLIGLVLLWTSDAWRVRDKVIATLLVPGGLATAGMLSLFSAGTVSSVVGNAVNNTGVADVVGAIVFWLCVLGPFFTACWLGWTANRHRARPELRREYAGAVS